VIVSSFEHPGVGIARCPAVLEALRLPADPSLLEAPLGRHSLDGDRLDLVLAEYDTQSPSCSFPETHRNHCDVQIVLCGVERIGWASLSTAWAPSSSYDPARDTMLYVAEGDLSWLVARALLPFRADRRPPARSRRRLAGPHP